MADTVPLLLRWLARVTGLALVGLVLVIAVGHGGLPNILEQPARVQIEFLGLFLMLAGLLIGWWKEALGGLVAFSGLATFCAVELIVNRRLPGGAIPYFLVPTILYLASWIADHVRRHRTGVVPPGNETMAAPRT